MSLVGMLPTTVPASEETRPVDTTVLAPFAVSKSTRGAPVAITSPGWPCNVFTTPENGAGTSTTAFAVSTASIGRSTAIASPTLTCQRTISASARPSPRSGRLKVVICAPLPCESFRKCFAHGVHDARSVRDVVVFEPGQRHDRVVAGHALDRRMQVIQPALGYCRGDFCSDATVAGCFVHDDEPTRFHHRLENRVVINGRQC